MKVIPFAFGGHPRSARREFEAAGHLEDLEAVQTLLNAPRGGYVGFWARWEAAFGSDDSPIGETGSYFFADPSLFGRQIDGRLSASFCSSEATSNSLQVVSYMTRPAKTEGVE